MGVYGEFMTVAASLLLMPASAYGLFAQSLCYIAALRMTLICVIYR